MAIINGNNQANDLSGTAGADSIYGMGGNDTLHGGLNDYLAGGTGDDLYYWAYQPLHPSVKNKYIFEAAGQGLDKIIVQPTGLDDVYMPDNIEDIDISGDFQSVIGNDLDNEITATGANWGVAIRGGGGDDILYGSDAGDGLYGGAGIDGMLGGKGDDYYQVDTRDDIIIEYSNEGYDTVSSLASVFKLGNQLEVLTLDADAVQRGTGNGLANLIQSNTDFTKFVNGGGGDDVVILTGFADDLVVGGSGNDTLLAGLGDDIYRTYSDFGWDEISDAGGSDAVEFDVNQDRLWFKRDGNDLRVAVIGTQNGVTVKNWYADSSAVVEEFYAGNGKLLTSSKVDQLVSAMSAFAQPTTTTMPASMQSVLAPTLAAVWQ